MAATWFNPVNIQNFSREAANVGALGAIQTTWAGYESNASVLDTEHRKQFSAMILAADYFWNGGEGPVPDALPYNADEVFTQAMNEASAEQQQEATRVRAGWLFDLAPFATRPAADWLGYNGEMGLTGLPPASAPGERLRDGIRYRGATNGGVLLLAGKLNPPGASAQPTSVTVPLSDIAAREVNLLLATSHRADKGTVVGSVTVTIADGLTQTTPLVYGKNIAAVDDLAATPDAPVVWQGAFSARGSDSAPGQHSTNQTHQAVLRRLTIRVPAPTMEGAIRSRVPLLRSLVITSENTEAAPAVFAVTLIK